MPYLHGKDKDGCYIKYGQSGKPYHYTCNDKEAEQRARNKAEKQAIAEHSHGTYSAFNAYVEFCKKKV